MKFSLLGDSCVLIDVGTAIDEATHARVLEAVRAIDAAPPDWVLDVVPAYTSLAVHYDAARLLRHAPDAAPHVIDVLREIVGDAPGFTAADTAEIVEIPVRYGGIEGPDLEHVASFTGLSSDEVVALHSGATYRVYVIGFAPGFPYMGGLPQRLEVPRRATPRMRVPAGSVAIAGAQSGIYPLETPGGWQIIGRTDMNLFDPHASPPALLRPGDRVRFIPA